MKLTVLGVNVEKVLARTVQFLTPLVIVLLLMGLVFGILFVVIPIVIWFQGGTFFLRHPGISFTTYAGMTNLWTFCLVSLLSAGVLHILYRRDAKALKCIFEW